MKTGYIYVIVSALCVLCGGCGARGSAKVVGEREAEAPVEVVVGAQLMDRYLPELKGKKVGVLANHTALVDGTHLVDTLLASGVDVRMVFAPEHGFRGTADAGEYVESYKDEKTGVDVISIYGRNKKPSVDKVKQLDAVVFDIQDVGLRYYTYLSSMHYMMESCAEAGVPMLVLDRPNPNGMYVDGPILDMKHKSFVGMHPIPVAHGMTLGELALMINGQGWLKDGLKCSLSVVMCDGYTHETRYELPVRPSPNLPDMRSVYLYSSLCFFEGTVVSVGRGTDFPFRVYGHPDMKSRLFTFTPHSGPAAKNPLHKDRLCYGEDLREGLTDEQVIERGVDLSYVVDAYRELGGGDKFFNQMFEKLVGVDYVRRMIIEGAEAGEIKARWSDDVKVFMEQRAPYMLYEPYKVYDE